MDFENARRVSILALFGAVITACSPAHESALRQAIDTNDVREVDRVLDAGADPNALDEYALTPLVRAVIAGNKSIVLELIHRGATPNPLHTSRTPLEVALDLDVVGANRKVVCDVSMVKLLLENGADVNGTLPGMGDRPLQRALEHGDVACVDALLAVGADANVYSFRIEPALQAAVAGASDTNNLELVTRILSFGADVNGPRGKRGSPLIEAVARKNVPVVQLLLKMGADPCLAERGQAGAWQWAHIPETTKELKQLMAPYHCRPQTP